MSAEKDAQKFSLAYISILASSEAPSTIVEILADLETEAALTPFSSDSAILLSNFYGIYFFALFLCDDLNEARFLSKRIPMPALQSDPLLISTYTLLRFLYTRNYAEIYTVIDSAPWSEHVSPLVVRFKDYYRQKTVLLLSKAYSSISPVHAAVYLGFKGDETGLLEYIAQRGWLLDESGLLKPAPVEVEEGGMDTDAEGNDMRIAILSGLVTHLTEV
ncbi:unnamed protein product [Tuber melanosporum]|jgi:COP9 signalosome complex subunit 8|uniref:(Perigord truffle) hypothetical protein n=1 Tax=Tuber melanosporum (strain Mel28) TaxID=656061 RepID=D5GN88_TUBMM|nr:uncharacterized protein GSTUM_00011158001 [Tuber melanosporum]CAZ85981.1 unnamed protein product [Tuber melanosporum]